MLNIIIKGDYTMKKSVLVLIVLLAVLIVTCVYQKTYAIYSTSPKELTLIERKTTTQSDSTVRTAVVEKKEQKTSTIPVVSVPTPIKPVEVKPVPKTKPVLEHKPVIKIEKVVAKEKVVVKEIREKAAPSKTNSAPTPKVPAVLTKEASVPKSEATQKGKKESENKPKSVTQNAAEKEIVDYIMWALNNRDIALKNRDEVEARIQELITKALNDRKVVLDERSKNEVELEKMQAELIDARDASYESVINPETTNQGEK